MSAEQQPEKAIILQAEKSDIPRLDFIVAGMGKTKTAQYFQRQLAYQQKGQRLLLIASAGGVDAGYCVLNWQPKYTFFRKHGIPEVQDINVLQHFRRQGIATMMIEYCENLAREKGKSHMGIGVSVSNGFGPAQRLYHKLGYQPDGYGVTYDRKPTLSGEMRPVDDQLCLMLMKSLGTE